jgi:GNAT superfamily N-acetyltransferase
MQDISIIEAKTPEQIAQIAALLRDYLLWMHRRYSKYGPMLDAYFDKRQWESELNDLAGHYGAPFGGMVLAYVDGVPAGCVLMRGIGGDVAEMKRLFVRPAFQGLGLGRQMAEALIELACDRAYSCMRLETGALQMEAQGLYRSMGFEPIAPYYACPEWLARHSHFYETKTCARAPLLVAA